MTEQDPQTYFRRAAAESLAADDPTGWFERVYAAAQAGEAIVPWDHHVPGPLLVSWAEAHRLDGHGKRAIVVGCGLGEDAEFLAGLGFSVLAFDISPTGIAAARERYPETDVDYQIADLFELPAEWMRGFDFVLEHATVQALPVTVRPVAIAKITELVAPGGTLLAILRARNDDEPARELPPFTLTSAEIESFAANGLTAVHLERPDETHWLAEFTR